VQEALATHLATALLEALGMKFDPSAPSDREALQKMMEAYRTFNNAPRHSDWEHLPHSLSGSKAPHSRMPIL
jgi:hypothetical protein